MSTPTDEQDAFLKKLRDLIERGRDKEDTFGSEMDDDARVWKVYSKAAQKHDKELLAQWNGTLDTLLIFAVLFSAVSTTFIIDSYKQMQPDYAQETFKLLLANISGMHYLEPSGDVEESARAVNCLWISSLIASLSTALIAILAKQWLTSYPVSDRENLREWAQLRQYRFDALEQWHVPVLIAVVPVLLHLSLMLFLAGLVVFLWDIDTGTMVLAFVLSAATYGLYGFTTLSPLIARRYASPVIGEVVYLWFEGVRSTVQRCICFFGDVTHRPSRGILPCVGGSRTPAIPSPGRSPAAVPIPGHSPTPDVPIPGHLQAPSVEPWTDPWITQTKFSDNVVAAALSWLGQNAETIDIYYAVLDSLGADVRGPRVSNILSPELKLRITAHTSKLISEFDSASSDLRLVVKHLRAAYHLRDQPALRDLQTWLRTQVFDVTVLGRTAIRTQRYYDTLLRVHVLPNEEDASDIAGCLAQLLRSQLCQDVRGSESVSLVLQSTASPIANYFITNMRVLRRIDVLTTVIALRHQLVAFPTLVACLLSPKFTLPALRTTDEHNCSSSDRGSFEAIGYLIHILEVHDFEARPWELSELSEEVAANLRSLIFETLALFCRKYSGDCRVFQDRTTSWLSRHTPLSRISLRSQDIAPFIRCCCRVWLSLETRLRLIRDLLHSDHSWHLPNNSDGDQYLALTACLDAVCSYDSTSVAFVGQLVPGLEFLLKDACLEPLQRMSKRREPSLLRLCARALARVARTIRGPLEGFDPAEEEAVYNLPPGFDIESLISTFISCEAATRTWDLATAGSDYILGLAELAPYPIPLQNLHDVCTSLCTLRRLYPQVHTARWKKMSYLVKAGDKSSTDPDWRESPDSDTDSAQQTLGNFYKVMGAEESQPGVPPQGLQSSGPSDLVGDAAEIDSHAGS